MNAAILTRNAKTKPVPTFTKLRVHPPRIKCFRLQELPTDYEQLTDTGWPSSCDYQVFPKAGLSPSNDQKILWTVYRFSCRLWYKFYVPHSNTRQASGTKFPFTITSSCRIWQRDPVLFTRNQTTQPNPSNVRNIKHCSKFEIQAGQVITSAVPTATSRSEPTPCY